MLQQAEELAKPGHPQNLMNIALLRWESTTFAGTQIAILEAYGATLQIEIKGRSTALSKSVKQTMNSKQRQ